MEIQIPDKLIPLANFVKQFRRLSSADISFMRRRTEAYAEMIRAAEVEPHHTMRREEHEGLKKAVRTGLRLSPVRGGEFK